MTIRREIMPEYPRFYEPRYGERPLQFVQDPAGCGWLCDKGVSPRADLRAQGCWRCDEMPFPDGGR